jgi:hypothetical protein
MSDWGSSGRRFKSCQPDHSELVKQLREWPLALPGLAAIAMALAVVLDNPRATSSKPPAAGPLVNILNQLRKSAQGAKPKLASVRRMTRPDKG